MDEDVRNEAERVRTESVEANDGNVVVIKNLTKVHTHIQYVVCILYMQYYLSASASKTIVMLELKCCCILELTFCDS